MHVDVLFPVWGEQLLIDHGYALYGAIARLAPRLHDGGKAFRFAAISGDPIAPGILRLNATSRLQLRLPQERIRDALPLAGTRLTVNGHGVRLGVPAVAAISPAPAIRARLVTFKHGEEPDKFLVTAKAKLAELGVTGKPAIPVLPAGPHAGECQRRVVRVKGVTIIGYALDVFDLSAEDSVQLQVSGLGGRARMGCGFFFPVTEGE